MRGVKDVSKRRIREGYDSPRDVMYDAFFSSTLIMAETWSGVNFTMAERT